jgi:hypothetical protein
VSSLNSSIRPTGPVFVTLISLISMISMTVLIALTPGCPDCFDCIDCPDCPNSTDCPHFLIFFFGLSLVVSSCLELSQFVLSCLKMS